MQRFIWGAVLCSFALVASAPAAAGELTGDQKAVWGVVMDSWDAIVKKDAGWTDKWVLPDAIVWGQSYPMPRTRASVKKWDRFDFQLSTTLTSDFSLGGIVTHGDTAVAHYYYSLGQEDQEGKKKVVHGRCTDVLARDKGSWKFIAWHCGDEPEDDD